MIRTVVDKFRDVCQIKLLPDNMEKIRTFYSSVGFTLADDFGYMTFKYVNVRNESTMDSQRIDASQNNQ